MKINYYADEGVKIPLFRKQILNKWIQQMILEYGFTLGEITYKFTTDEGILEINKLFLNHDYYTDILTFDARENIESKEIIGDILISLERVNDNANSMNLPFEEELHRVLIHGILHLCGLKDKTEEEEQQMRIAEDRALYVLHNLVGDNTLLKKS